MKIGRGERPFVLFILKIYEPSRVRFSHLDNGRKNRSDWFAAGRFFHA